MVKRIFYVLALSAALCTGCSPKVVSGQEAGEHAQVSATAPAEVKRFISDLEGTPPEQRVPLLQQNSAVITEIFAGRDEGAKNRLRALMRAAQPSGR